MLERVFAIAHWPFRPRSSAVAAAAATSEGGSPARSAGVSSTVR